MPKIINKTMVFSAIATVAGLFVYKTYISSIIKDKLGGTNNAS